MTLGGDNGNVLSMATKRSGKPIPREGTTPAEYKRLLAHRIKTKRELLQLSQSEVADRLSAACHREIRADSYRKWETEEAIVQVDAIMPLCDILRIHVFDLLSRTPTATEEIRPKRSSQGKAVA